MDLPKHLEFIKPAKGQVLNEYSKSVQTEFFLPGNAPPCIDKKLS